MAADEIESAGVDAEVISPDDLEVEDDATTPAGLHESLIARATAAGIEFRTRTFDNPEFTYTDIGLPSGRDKRWLSASGGRLTELLSVDFEKYIFLSGYEAICSYTDRVIEVSLRGAPMSPMLAMRRLLASIDADADSELSEFILSPPDGVDGRPRFRIGLASNEFAALSQLPGSARRYTLRLENCDVTQHDEARSLLIRYSNSLFFQIDMHFGASFILERERVRRMRPIRRNESVEVLYPLSEYDEAPMSLYWYARGARGMPLLQFLAFYQCIEFYFPTFSQSEARRKVAILLKDPTFRADRDSDVARLLSTIFVGRSGGIGDERTQLRAAINECLTSEELRAFFENDKERWDHFLGKTKKGRFSKISLSNAASDIRNDVADRVYDIRCKIVHTKDGDQYGEGGMILPFSDEANVLMYEIELLEFLARKVLIATSTVIA